jgi:hypothetical protein
MAEGTRDGKAAELKAEPMDTGRLDRWLAGKISRRILVAPFYGPADPARFGYTDLKGRDLDGEYFHPEDADGPATDFYGPYPSLRASRERLTDWHHATFAPASNSDPAPSKVKANGAIVGHIVMDEDPEDDGLWADFWANAGENRRRLVALLERRQVPMYASTQPIKAGIVKGDAGRIDVWPIRFNTISTSPQNTYAVMPALKAALTDPNFDEIPADAIKAFLTGLEQSAPDLRPTFLDEAADTYLDGTASDAATVGRLSIQASDLATAGILAALRRLGLA